MKRVLAILIMVASVAFASAQTYTNTPQSTPVEQAFSVPKTDWLTAFSGVKVDGPMNVEFRKVSTPEESKITYDTKGNITSKFKYEIDKNGVLVVSEKSDPKRTTVTDITIYYHKLADVRIAHAKAEFVDTIEETIFDITVTGGGMAVIAIKTLDVAVECTGQSRLTIKGDTKYMSMRVSTAKVDCSELSTVSTIAEVSHSAEVRLNVSERLEATTSTGAKLLYKGHPIILRDHTVIFGGDIININ